MKKRSTKYLIIGISIAIGLIAGFLYWRFVGCKSGSCPITSNWHSSVLIGGVIGYLAGDTVNDYRNKKPQPQK